MHALDTGAGQMVISIMGSQSAVLAGRGEPAPHGQSREPGRYRERAEPSETTMSVGRVISPKLGVVVLAGGRGSRLGGVYKPGIRVGGNSLLRNLVDSVLSLDHRPYSLNSIVVVGPPGPIDAALVQPGHICSASRVSEVRVVQESPRFGGPGAALAAGLAELAHSADGVLPDVVLIAGGDLTGDVSAAFGQLLTAASASGVGVGASPPAPSGVAAVDDNGRPKWDLSVWAGAALAASGVGANKSLRSGLPTDSFVPVPISNEGAAPVVWGVNSPGDLLDLLYGQPDTADSQPPGGADRSAEPARCLTIEVATPGHGWGDGGLVLPLVQGPVDHTQAAIGC